MDAIARGPVNRKLVRASALAAMVSVFFLLTGVASATPPGTNGRIAFSSDRDGDFDIYTMNLDGSGLVHLDFGGDDFNAAWSPDGTKIAFSSTQDGDYDVYVRNANGTGAVTQLTDESPDGQTDDWTPSWSPDGTEIAFGSFRDATTAEDENVYKMNADGSGIPDQLTTDPASEGAPAFSPDGTKIAFRSKAGGCPSNCYWELLTMNPDGTNPTELTENDNPYEVDASWSPDGSQLVFQVNPSTPPPPPDPDNNPPSNDIWRVDADDPDSEIPLTENNVVDGAPSWSPDGSLIAFQSNRAPDFDSDIYTMNPEEGEDAGVTQITDHPAEDLDVDWQRLYYPRPAGASPFRASLVPAYKQCVFANNQHGAPASFISCSPPKQHSSHLTVGTVNANGQASQASGSVRIEVIDTTLPTEDDQFTVSLTDVRCQGTSGGCAGSMEDYAGDVQANATFRITDRYNGGVLDDPATVIDFPFSWSIPCTATGASGLPNAIGSTCASVTTANALIPGFVKFGERQIIELGQMKVFDGGADGSTATGSDNNLFQIQGIFNP